MLSNAYFLVKFRFDTAENEPAKKLQNFANFGKFADPNLARDHGNHGASLARVRDGGQEGLAEEVRAVGAAQEGPVG